jgi:hypothetical protein
MIIKISIVLKGKEHQVYICKYVPAYNYHDTSPVHLRERELII